MVSSYKSISYFLIAPEKVRHIACAASTCNFTVSREQQFLLPQTIKLIKLGYHTRRDVSEVSITSRRHFVGQLVYTNTTNCRNMKKIVCHHQSCLHLAYFD